MFYLELYFSKSNNNFSLYLSKMKKFFLMLHAIYDDSKWVGWLFNRGIWKGLKTLIPYGGHTEPTSILGENLL